ncbi:hypothetical protein HAHI6034_05730 [Hathewaya histolytica]|uniref:DUF4352 domain-containing protein n=1 Tax=Hathewaya histolytica TaxID=1498 RepID=A0A4U9RFE9_HATHI|nr:hypothetical protein [Hathewaya histolytica]VTQ89771.1 Uncharacterised protein [Hathewaya histolytica]
MPNYIKNNLTALLALFVSIASFFLSFKNYIKSIVKFKISYDLENSYSLGFLWYQEYKLLIVDLTIENNSTSSVDISKIKLIDENNTYIASTIEISDKYNENGISLVNSPITSYKPLNITSQNILNNPRVPSYGTLNGFAVFNNIEPLEESKSYTIIIHTPSKSFKKSIIINPLTGDFKPIHPLKD